MVASSEASVRDEEEGDLGGAQEDPDDVVVFGGSEDPRLAKDPRSHTRIILDF